MKNNKAKQMIDNTLTSLTESLKSGHTSELKNCLLAMGQFRHHSLRNILLIAHQKPNATHVIGCHAWKKFDRIVKKGEKSIIIVTPFVQQKDTVELDYNKYSVTEMNGFKAIDVYDVSQTDGEERLCFPCMSGDPCRQQDMLDDLISANGIVLEYLKNIPVDGFSTARKITIRIGLSPLREYSLKVHELAHVLLHHTGGRLSKTQKEIEAEAITYVVCLAFSQQYHTTLRDYIRFYKDNQERLISSLQRIKDVSGRILTGLEQE